MTPYNPVKINELTGWHLRFALATYVGMLETKPTPSLKSVFGEPFGVMEVITRPCYRQDGTEIKGKTVTQPEPRKLRDEELFEICSRFEVACRDEGLAFACRVGDGDEFISNFPDEAKGRAIIASVVNAKTVLIPDL